MTLYELAKLHQNGCLDMDVTDKEIDMAVCIIVDTNEEPKDDYDRFIDVLARNVKVEWWRENMICCDFSGLYRKHRKEFADAFDENCGGYWEFDKDEMEYNMALWTESFVAGCSGMGTYKDLVEILSK